MIHSHKNFELLLDFIFQYRCKVNVLIPLLIVVAFGTAIHCDTLELSKISGFVNKGCIVL